MEKIEIFLKHIIKEAGNITLGYFGTKLEITTKTSKSDVLTQADIATNDYIVSAIKKQFPDHGIISEEMDDYQTDAEYVWIIDPIDGTFNFSTSVPIYAVLIALAKNGELILAATYLPKFDELLFAKKESGTFLNGVQVFVTQENELNHSSATASGRIKPEYAGYAYFTHYLAKFNTLTLTLNSFSCLGYDHFLVATGRRDWTFHKGASLWDYAAGALLLQEAGAKVTNLKGEPWSISDREILAANPVLHSILLEHMKKSFEEYAHMKQ